MATKQPPRICLQSPRAFFVREEIVPHASSSVHVVISDIIIFITNVSLTFRILNSVRISFPKTRFFPLLLLFFSFAQQLTSLDSRVRVSGPKSKKKKKNVPEVVRMRVDGVDEDLQKLLDLDLDQAPTRRVVRRAFKEIQLAIDHCLFKVLKH